MFHRFVSIDLYRDWIDALRHELVSFGYNSTTFGNNEDVCHKYFNLIHRLIKPVPRSVLKSTEFTCPIELENGLKKVERKISSGVDLYPHLSKSIRNPDYNDSLLNDWGIYHIHLGTKPDDKNPSFMERTEPVLFVRFDEENAYFINILPHGSWWLKKLVSILHRNWPNSISQYCLNVVNLEHIITDNDVKELRKSNVTTLVKVEDIVYRPIGDGFATSGLSLKVGIRCDYYANRLRFMQDRLIEKIDFIAEEAAKNDIDFPINSEFGLEIKDNVVYAVEINSMFRIKLFKI